MTATVIFEARLADFEKFKTVMNRGNQERRDDYTATGHTMARDLTDPDLVRLIVDFDNLDSAKEWMAYHAAPETLDAIRDMAALAERPRIWLGTNVDHARY